MVRSGVIDDNGTTVSPKASQRVFCNLMSTSRDPAIFPEPEKVDWAVMWTLTFTTELAHTNALGRGWA
jgi:hypothetical protein